MAFKNFLIVLGKELKDIFRDRKSLISSLIMPVILYPLLLLFMGGGMDGLFTTDETVRVAVISAESDADAPAADARKVADILAADENCRVLTSYADLSEAAEALVRGDLSVIVRVGEGFAGIDEGGKYEVSYVVDNRSTAALRGADAVRALIGGYAEDVYRSRVENAVTEEELAGLECISGGQSVSADAYVSRGGTDNSLVLMVIPILVTLLISVGGSSVAVDLIAGEKERGTFEPLLSTSAGRFSILSAKYVVVIVYAFIAAAVQVASMGIGIALSPSAFGGAGGLSLDGWGVALAFFNILLLAALFCSVMLVLSATAKTFKEASAKTSFIVFVPLILAYVTMFTDAVDVGFLNMICPVVNVCFVVKMVLAGYIYYPFFIVSLVSNVLYVALALGVTLYVFGRESLISRA